MKALVTSSRLRSGVDPVWKIVSSWPEGRPRWTLLLAQLQHSLAMRMATSSRAFRRQSNNVRKLRRQARPKAVRAQAPVDLEQLEPVHRRAAGLDIGSAENYVAVPADAVAPGESAVRVFGSFSEQQDALVEWLRQCGITTVAMEATGVYWLSLYDKLEAARIEVYLVDPHGVKAVPGRKSDWMDCQWLQKLHTYGLLQRAFRPDAPIRRLRTLTRQRAELVCTAASQQQHMEKALVCMNLQLGLVISDLVGETGMSIIRAILRGERDPEQLVKQYRSARCTKASRGEMKQALRGTYNQEDLFILQQNVDTYDFVQQQIQACDAQIEAVLAAIPTAVALQIKVPPPLVPAAAEQPRKKGKPTDGKNAPKTDFTEALRRICGVDLTQIPGLNLLSVLMILGEIGTDMSRWRSVQAFSSWLGLCPGAKISGGKVLSRRTRKVINRAATLLRIAAVAVGRTDTWLGLYYRRMKARKGGPKAVTATARKLACIIYHMLKFQQEYTALDMDKYAAIAEAHRLRYIKREAKKLGYDLVAAEQDA
jgi:transposase